MPHKLRLLLIALLLACPAVVLPQLAAQAACTCKSRPVQQSAARADAVFGGTLVDQSTERTGAKGNEQTTYEIKADRLYKGDISAAQVEVVSGGDCGLGTLKANRRYVFFVQDTGTSLTTNKCSGTAPARAPLTREVEKALGEGTDLTAQQPPAEKAVFEKVDDAEPDTLMRLAAPGAALVIVGLLGLLLVARLARR